MLKLWNVPIDIMAAAPLSALRVDVIETLEVGGVFDLAEQRTEQRRRLAFIARIAGLIAGTPRRCPGRGQCGKALPWRSFDGMAK